MSLTTLAPVGVRGMKVLDREKFLRNILVPILKVSLAKLSKVTPICKPYLLKLEKFKPVQDCDDPMFNKCIYLNPDKVNKWMDISEADRLSLSSFGVEEANLHSKELQLTYENWKSDDIFKAVLPENEDIVSGFSQIGHIIHLNLRDHLLEYRPLIGQVLVDKIATCKTVVNKSNIIDNTYRNFSMEVIAGVEDFIVNVKENKCNFKFDFSKVYWNPRLGKEHERILEFLKSEDVLFDVFCGVGPFSVPAAKRRIKVFANDLNPDSYNWLNINAKNNKVDSPYFKSYNMDGKDFICDVFKKYLMDCLNGCEKLEDSSKIHITMNLPAMAVQFLKYFKGLLKNEERKCDFDKDIIVYVYCFVVGEEPELLAKNLVIENIAADITSNIVDIFNVRNVSPKKEMMRITFKLTKDLLFSVNSDNSEPPMKKMCKEN